MMMRLLLAFGPVVLFAIGIRLVAGYYTRRAKRAAAPPAGPGKSGPLSTPHAWPGLRGALACKAPSAPTPNATITRADVP